MRKLLILFALTAVLNSCDKDDRQTEAAECVVRMKELYEEELKCTQEDFMEVNLYKGVYEGEVVYFPMIMCPHCSVLPPADGYTCDGKKVVFEDFREVGDIKQVYNSCSKSYVAE